MDERKLFLDFCASNFGRAADALRAWDPAVEGDDPITVLIWNDTPEVGLLTAVTYGLSKVGHDEWYMGRPELMVRVDSEDPAWPLAIAYFADAFRGELPFEYGTVLCLDEPIAEDSSMCGFLLFAPPLVEGEEMTCETGDELPIQLTGCYPVYEGEAAVIKEDFEGFWNREDYDIFSVTRPDVSG